MKFCRRPPRSVALWSQLVTEVVVGVRDMHETVCCSGNRTTHKKQMGSIVKNDGRSSIR